MLKRKKYLIGLLIMVLSVSSINLNSVFAESNSVVAADSTENQDSEDEANLSEWKTCIGKDNIKWAYFVLEDGTIAIFQDDDLSGEVEIPSKLNGFTVSTIGNMSSNTKITGVKIPNTVKSIEESAFFGCTSLTNIEIPASVTCIEFAAFENTPWLTNKRNSNPLVVVNNILIDARDATGDVTIPSNVTTIGSYAFAEYHKDGSTHYDYGHSKDLTSVVIPEGVKRIEEGAFHGCYNLINIQIPTSITEIEGDPFSSTAWLKALEQTNEFVVVNNMLVSVGTATGDVTIPSNVISILDNAFMGVRGITSVKIPSSVKEIGKGAFSQCSDLSEILIPDSVENIDEGAFSSCTSLQSIKLPKNLKSIKQTVFEFCENLTSIDIPSGVTTIEDSAFLGYINGLVNVRIPASVVNLSDSAFLGCNNLKSAYCEKNSYSSKYFKKKGIGVEEYDKYTANTPATTPSAHTPADAKGAKVPQSWHKDGEYWNWIWSDGTKRTGWYEENGQWYYFYGNGQMATEFTSLGNGFIYYLKPNSIDGKASMVTGWQKINGEWFFFNPKYDGYRGMMKRGWIYDGGNWYYLYSTGEMAHNTTIDGYYVNSSGAWAQ